MANPRFTTRWGLASDERVRSPRSIEHCPPGAQSIAYYSESFVEEKLPPPKPWLDGSKDDQRRFHTISAPWEREAWTRDSCYCEETTKMRDCTGRQGCLTQSWARIEFWRGSAIAEINFPSHPQTVKSSQLFSEDARQQAVVRLGLPDATQPKHCNKLQTNSIYLQFPHTKKNPKSLVNLQTDTIQFNSPVCSCHSLYTLDLDSATCSDKETR